MTAQSSDPVSILIGSRLSSVEFVQDYVQLRFDGPTLTAITRPRVIVAGKSLQWGQPGYRDALCDRIGDLVRGASSDARAILIGFANDAEITVSLRPEDYRAADAAILDNPPNPMVSW